MSGPTVKMLTYPALMLTCPECGASVAAKHRGGGNYAAHCQCGLKVLLSSVIEKAKETT